MKWDDIKDQISRFAPVVGGAVGGPAGAVVGRLLASVFGTDDPAEVARIIESDPDAALKLKKLEFDHAEKIASIELEHKKNEVEDRSNARENHAHSRMPAVICIGLTLAVMMFGAALFVAVIPEGNTDIAYILFGTLVAKWGDSVAYWVGTSRGSAEKNKLMRL